MRNLAVVGDFTDNTDPEKFRYTSCGSWLDRMFKYAAFFSVGMDFHERKEWVT